MGNLQSHIEENVGHNTFSLADSEKKILHSTDFNTWKERAAETYGFSQPCLEYHTNVDIPYSSQKCYSIEVTGTRRRTVEFRKDLSCYSGDLETTSTARHIIHIRQHIMGRSSMIPLQQSSAPELDYMVDPIMTVLAYHCDIVVLSVKDKTKNIPKVILFCDVGNNSLFGVFSIPVQYNNLSGVSVSCCSSVDGSNFVIYVMEDHYDEFNLHMYAMRFEDKKAVVRNMLTSGHSSWYEPNIHTSYLGCSNDVLVTLGDYPLGLTYSDPSRYLLTFDIANDKVAQCIALTDNLYPVSLTCSSDATWICTLSRDPSAWEGDAEGYVVRLYTAESLSLTMEVKVPLAIDNFNSLSHCSKIMFSQNNTLLAVTSSDTREDFGPDFYGYCGGLSKKGTKGVQVTVYRLPVVKINLKALCRDTILSSCKHEMLASLPLPNSLKSYLSYIGKQGR